LTFNRRRPAELAGRNLHIVGFKGSSNILNGHLVICQLIGIEPNPHGILSTEDLHFADARHSREHFFQSGLCIIPQIVAIHASIFRDQASKQKVISSGFADFNPLPLHYLGQACHGQLQLVLHLGPSEIRVGSRGKGQLDASIARGVTIGGHIQHLVETGHLLFDDLRYAVLDSLRRGAWIEGGNSDRWRGDGGILRNRHVVDRKPSRRHDNDGDDPRKYRTVQKES